MSMTPAAMSVSADAFRWRVAAGTEIFREGATGETAFIIERGTVHICMAADGRGRVRARRGPGEIFGEMALIDSRPRSATAVAATDCELLVISREMLTAHIAQAQPVMQMLVETLLERFRDTVARLGDVPRPPPSALPASGAPAPDDALTPRAPSAAPATAIAPDPALPVAAALAAQAEAAGRHAAAIDRIKLEQRLTEAIAAREFELHYQPLLRLADGTVAGFEALVRWRHPQLGLIAPDAFLGVAEDSGLIGEIGRWALGAATDRLGRLQAAAARAAPQAPPLFMTVNISCHQVQAPDFLAGLDAAVAGAGLGRGDLTLEVTESVLMEDPAAAIETLRGVRERGLAVALDDFGTGYSSLSYLHRFPIDILKIDRSFVASMGECAHSAEITRSIVRLARGLGIGVIGEGIETRVQADRLARLGCDYGQGFLYAPPLPGTEAEALLAGEAPAGDG